MLDTLVTSKTRLKLILKFFLNSTSSAYLKELAKEFGESSNAVRLELNRFEQAGLLESEVSGNKKLYHANVVHPLYNDIHNIISKTIGIDQIIDVVVDKLGDVEEAYITGDFAVGKNGKTIDILLIGTNVNRNFLHVLIEKAESLINRKIRYLILSPSEVGAHIGDGKGAMLIWKKEL
ncbi:MAG: winged helix-turn-helix domain-containing protein [Bacteroidia bacterium]|nr:winged helix-turn-helix domain-containing protein [Bacteroidia bacterium]